MFGMAKMLACLLAVPVLALQSNPRRGTPLSRALRSAPHGTLGVRLPVFDASLVADEELPRLGTPVIWPVRHPMATRLHAAVGEGMRGGVQRPRHWTVQRSVHRHCVSGRAADAERRLTGAVQASHNDRLVEAVGALEKQAGGPWPRGWQRVCRA